MKKDYRSDLNKLFKEKNYKKIEDYLLLNSNLPSPRANLELAKEFSIFFDNKDIQEGFWDLLVNWIKIDESKLEDNSPLVYLIFLSLEAYGHIIVWLNKIERIKYFKIYEEKMNSKLWRVREACVIGLQDFWEKKYSDLIEYFNELYPKANRYERRAIFATLAHPQILIEKEVSDFALDITDKELVEISNFSKDTLKIDSTKTLMKSMEYVISVFTVFNPHRWFEIMEKYLEEWNPIVVKIIKKNLEKNRLKRYEKEKEKLYRLI